LFDEKGEMQDKFKAKGNSEISAANDHPFVVQDICYSPDNARLALAQSDNILYVYKLGLEWKEKKSISNKFPVQVMPQTHICMSSPCKLRPQHDRQ
jgi:intraflagellar transport protein 172